MEYTLERNNVSNIHIPDSHIIVYNAENPNGIAYKISSELKAAEGTDSIQFLSTFSYLDKDYSFTTHFNESALLEILVECWESPNKMDITDHPYISHIVEESLDTFIREVKQDYSTHLFFKQKSTNLYNRGLGIIKQHGKISATFEAFTLILEDEKSSLFLDSLLTINKELTESEWTCEYYNFFSDEKIIFTASSEEGHMSSSQTFELINVEEINYADTIVGKITDALETYIADASYNDIIGEQKYNAYVESRKALASEVIETERKKAVTNKFADIALV